MVQRSPFEKNTSKLSFQILFILSSVIIYFKILFFSLRVGYKLIPLKWNVTIYQIGSSTTTTQLLLLLELLPLLSSGCAGMSTFVATCQFRLSPHYYLHISFFRQLVCCYLYTFQAQFVNIYIYLYFILHRYAFVFVLTSKITVIWLLFVV